MCGLVNTWQAAEQSKLFSPPGGISYAHTTAGSSVFDGGLLGGVDAESLLQHVSVPGELVVWGEAGGMRRLCGLSIGSSLLHSGDLGGRGNVSRAVAVLK